METRLTQAGVEAEAAVEEGSAGWRKTDQYPSAGSLLRIALVVETEKLRTEIWTALLEIGATAAFDLSASVNSLEAMAAVEREHPEVLFVETAKLGKSPAEWIGEIRRGGDLPLVVALHAEQDPEEMIRALRGGATEFLSLPLRPAFYEAIDRTTAILEARRAAVAQRGKVIGFLSAKGGCGATAIACHVAAAFAQVTGKPIRSLVADLDYQASSAASMLRVAPRRNAFDALDQVRRLNTNSWRDLVVQAMPNLDLLAGSAALPRTTLEPWRVEALFRYMARSYAYVCADLGRQLNTANWGFLQNIEDLYLVTGPDVLALYQTRSILQTLTGRGFDKSRVKLILNLNHGGPQDFWKESIEQMFEMQVYFVLPHDDSRDQPAATSADERFRFPDNTEFGRHILKLTAKIAGVVPAKAQSTGLFRRSS